MYPLPLERSHVFTDTDRLKKGNERDKLYCQTDRLVEGALVIAYEDNLKNANITYHL